MSVAAVPARGSAACDGIKRALDFSVAAAALIAVSPLMAAIAVAVRLSSPGPAVFKQERVGRWGKPFLLLKFRSMRCGKAEGPLVTAGGDPRITSLGRLIRRTKLDELPQLWNVLVGDMSLVGPRPEVRRYVEVFPVDYQRILSVRPGITDLAALRFYREEELLASSPDPERTYIAEVLPQKIKLYLEYVETRSLALDFRILLKTLRALLP